MLQHSETYDWRLSVPNMEKRDSYFTRLKWRIELTHLTGKEKVCPSICSSLGPRSTFSLNQYHTCS